MDSNRVCLVEVWTDVPMVDAPGVVARPYPNIIWSFRAGL